MNQEVTVFKNIKSTDIPYYVELNTIIDRIRTGGKSKQLLSKIRSTDNKSERNELKKELTSICFSGTFSKRSAKAITKHSGIICLDFDGFESQEKMLEMKKDMCEDSYVLSCFISPSGKGLKVLVKIPPVIEDHKQHFNSLAEYFTCDEWDGSGSDVSRVCYTSYDPEIYVNYESDTYTDKSETKIDKVVDTDINVITIDDDDQKIDRLRKWFDKNYSMAEGGRNENLFKFAAALNVYGVNRNVAENYLISQYVESDFPRSEIKTLTNSAYSNKKDFNTKSFEDAQRIKEIRRDLKKGDKTKLEIYNNLIDEGIEKSLARDTIKEIERRDKEENYVFWKIDDKGKVQFSPTQYREFLEDNGFYKFVPEGSTNYIFVRKISNRVNNVIDTELKDFVMKYVENVIRDTMVWDALANNRKMFEDNFINMIDTIEIDFIEDTPTEAYLFYQNVALRVKANSIEQIQYEDLPGWIWNDQVIDRDYTECDPKGFEFDTFVRNISGNNYDTFKSVIGYYMHSYKFPSENKAIIFNDEVISEDPNGGTGKSLLSESIGKIKKFISIDGKKDRNGDKFEYQRVQQDTQVLFFDDVKPNFNFTSLFSMITGGITIEKKNKDEIRIPLERSPKIGITTNYAIKGSGNSHDRRRFEIEVKQYYGAHRSPVDDFGRHFFSDWDTNDWCQFDNLMIGYLQYYLSEGLVKADNTNIKTRKFIQETSFSFYEFMNDKDSGYRVTGAKHSLNAMRQDFMSMFPEYGQGVNKIGVKQFKGWIKMYGQYKYDTDPEIKRYAEGMMVIFRSK